MLIATLGAIHQTELNDKIMGHSAVAAARFNTGSVSPYSPQETLEKLLEQVKRFGCDLWLDLKGRQLRIKHWAVPNYGEIHLNHEIDVQVPAKVFFRGNQVSEVKVVKGNVIYVDPAPPKAVGAGQAINIIGKDLRIKGFLTETDKAFITAAKELGIHNYMLSFVEQNADLTEVLELDPQAQMILKIESLPGMDFVKGMMAKSEFSPTLMAARDDLMINVSVQQNPALILSHLKTIIEKDPQAICASRIFSGLEKDGQVSLADWADMHLMRLLGYNHFMLSDNISHFYFDQAIKAWQTYLQSIVVSE